MELNDFSDVGRAYTKYEDLRYNPSVSALDKGVAKLRFELYHTVVFDGELYALHEDGVDANGKAVCCGTCANQVDKCVATNQVPFKGASTPDNWVIAKLINLSKSFFASMDVRKHRSHPKRERGLFDN